MVKLLNVLALVCALKILTMASVEAQLELDEDSFGVEDGEDAGKMVQAAVQNDGAAAQQVSNGVAEILGAVGAGQTDDDEDDCEDDGEDDCEDAGKMVQTVVQNIGAAVQATAVGVASLAGNLVNDVEHTIGLPPPGNF